MRSKCYAFRYISENTKKSNAGNKGSAGDKDKSGRCKGTTKVVIKNELNINSWINTIKDNSITKNHHIMMTKDIF